jgi:phthiocerol/phenolphthiocerol synthesis type-I polyketide synthase E
VGDGGRQRVAVTGMACRLPGASDLETLWSNLCAGRDSIVRAASDPRKGSLVHAAGMVEDAELFDAEFFRMPPREVEATHPQQRVFLECAWEALETAGLARGGHTLRIGVFASCSDVGHPAAGDDLDPLSIGVVADFLATRLAYKLNLTGPAVTVQTSCSASLTALHLACRSILAGDCDAAVVGGVSIASVELAPYEYHEGGVLSPDGACRAFDEAAAGTVPGNGAAAVVLRSLEGAMRDGDPLLALVAGSAINNDGATKVGFAAPSVSGQVDVLERALEDAGVEPAAVGYVEAHGTGTPLGDPIEVGALRRVYGVAGAPECLIGSIKSNIGHLDAAAGIAGFVKAVLAVRHAEIPPTAHFRRAHPALRLDGTRFSVNAQTRAWEGPAPRRAGVSSFGIGGTNAHVIVEQALVPRDRMSERPANVAVMAARSREALAGYAESLDLHVAVRRPDRDALCYTLQTARSDAPFRLARVCESASDLHEETSNLDDVRPAPESPRVVFVFGGQGGQDVGLARGILETSPTFREHFSRCDDAAQSAVAISLHDVLYPDDPAPARALLERPIFAHLSIFALEYALARTMHDYGIEPDAMVGVSLGEYACAAVAGSLTVEDAVAIVAERALLAESLPEGAMVVVHETPDKTTEMIPSDLDVAGIMGPEATVVAGPTPRVARFENELQRRGIPSTRVRSTRAYHSRAVEPIVAPFEAFLAERPSSEPTVPYISNVTGEWITPTDSVDPSYWARHLRSPFRAAAGLAALAREASVFVELGPPAGLAAAVRKHASAAGAEARYVQVLRHGQADGRAALLQGLADLWSQGCSVDWRALYAGAYPRRIHLPAPKLARRAHPFRHAPATTYARDVLERDDAATSWLYRTSWQGGGEEMAPAGAQASGDASRPVWVVGPRSGLAGVAARAWREVGGEVIELEAKNDASLEEQRAWWEDVFSSLPAPSLIVDAEAARPTGVTANDVAPFYHLLALGQVLRVRDDPAPAVVVVTASAHPVLGTEHLDPAAAMLQPLCEVIRQEDPELRINVVDFSLGDDPQVIASGCRSVAAETRSGVRHTALAYRGRRRWTRTFVRVDPAPDTPSTPLRTNGVYVVTGGLGEVGLSLAEAMSAQTSLHMVLVGRTAPEARAAANPERRIVERIEAMRAASGSVTFVEGDVTSEASLGAALARVVADFGGMDGLVHAAGPEAARTFREVRAIDLQHCEHHFATKVRGLRVLESLLPPLDLDFVVLCSSLASILGGVGYAAYAAANAFENAEAHRMSESGRTRWLSIAWEAWRESDAVKGLPSSDVLDRLGLRSAEGGEAFLQALTIRESQLAISTTDLATRISHYLVPPAPLSPEDDAPRMPSRQNEGLDPIERAVVEVWRRRLGLADIPRTANYFDIGGDSITAIAIRADLEAEFQVELGFREMLEAGTVAAIAAQLRSRVDGRSSSTQSGAAS